MTITIRSYRQSTDYQRVGDFLTRTYRTEGNHINWVLSRWEYMHYHPYVLGVDLSTIGLWEDDGEIVAVVHPEHPGSPAYLEVDPSYRRLLPDMLDHAEVHLTLSEKGEQRTDVFINDRDVNLQGIAKERGYQKTGHDDPMSHFPIPDPFPAITLPQGFRLQSLAEENNLHKLHRLLYRGFNHGDEPPDDGIDERTFMQSAPNYDKALNIVAVAPDDGWTAYCGMWYEPATRIAYVEPVCTDPAYRRMGLASAATFEGIRRCGERGATVAYVGATLPVYLSMGFTQIYNCTVWRKRRA